MSTDSDLAASLPTSEQWATLCANDGEFGLASRYWSGGLRLEIADAVLALALDDGSVTARDPGEGAGVLTFKAPLDVWRKLLSPVPPKRYNDIMALSRVGMAKSGDILDYAQFYAAIMRAIELLRSRQPVATPPRDEPAPTLRFDAAVGRYIHIELHGDDYRLYFEEAGEGIPILLQHTAGSDGSQWRHLLECREITDHFRLIAYDLPYHGKSLPPTTKPWWSEEYRLTGEFLRSVPVALCEALNLDRPVFMGCSIGGLLALDLALHHADIFRAVISLEGALKIEEGRPDDYPELWHPQVSDDFKGRSMDALMSPMSPTPYRKETAYVYASSWPPAFRGDLYYYMVDFDMRESAARINTEQIGVHILSGEYDYSATPELGRAAHDAIAGSTWTEMAGLGHFPMSENPVEFIKFLLPVLRRLRSD